VWLSCVPDSTYERNRARESTTEIFYSTKTSLCTLSHYLLLTTIEARVQQEQQQQTLTVSNNIVEGFNDPWMEARDPIVRHVMMVHLTLAPRLVVVVICWQMGFAFTQEDDCLQQFVMHHHLFVADGTMSAQFCCHAGRWKIIVDHLIFCIASHPPSHFYSNSNSIDFLRKQTECSPILMRRPLPPPLRLILIRSVRGKLS